MGMAAPLIKKKKQKKTEINKNKIHAITTSRAVRLLYYDLSGIARYRLCVAQRIGIFHVYIACTGRGPYCIIYARRVHYY